MAGLSFIALHYRVGHPVRCIFTHFDMHHVVFGIHFLVYSVGVYRATKCLRTSLQSAVHFNIPHRSARLGRTRQDRCEKNFDRLLPDVFSSSA